MTVVTMKIITNLGYVARLTPDTCWFMSAWSRVPLPKKLDVMVSCLPVVC